MSESGGNGGNKLGNGRLEDNQEEHANTQRLGVEIVELLRSNTHLNYDVCALNMVGIFELLGSRLASFNSTSRILVESIKQSVSEPESNPDLTSLNNSLKCLSDLTDDLKSGEKNFYECNQHIEACLKLALKLLYNQTQPEVFQPVLIEHRQTCLNLFEIWQLSTNKVTKNLIIDFFNLSFYSDKIHISLLYDSSSLPAELCCLVKQYFSLSDHVSISRALRCLILMIENSEKISTQFLEFLKTNDILNFVLSSIESEENLMLEKVDRGSIDHLMNELSISDPLIDTTTVAQHHNSSNNNNVFLVDMFIHFLLALNKKFNLPQDNLVLSEILSKKDTSHKMLSEYLIKVLNLEKDPLDEYKIITKPKNPNLIANMESIYLNSVIKFLSDLFSTNETIDTTGIFYSSDFLVLIDIIIRKLANLSAVDQIRVDYLSLIQLIIKNSDYKARSYRVHDLLECFNSILNEKDQHTVDQDLVGIILTENPELLN